MYALTVDHVEPDPDAGTDHEHCPGDSHPDLPNAGEPHTGNVDARGDASTRHANANTGHANPDNSHESDAGHADHAHYSATGGVTTTPPLRRDRGEASPF